MLGASVLKTGWGDVLQVEIKYPTKKQNRMTKTSVRGNQKRAFAPIFASILCALLFLSTFSFAQQAEAKSKTGSSGIRSVERDYPKEIRGYKVERARVELKKQPGAKDKTSSTDEPDDLIRLGDPRVVRVTPLGITLEVQVTVAPVKQGGRVDFLTFEDMTVNGTPVTLNEYHHSFELPTHAPLTLPEPVTIYINSPRVLLGAIGEWRQPKDLWPVTGRVYVFGRFKKFLFNFKRVVPVELNLSFKNPLKSKAEG